MATDRMLKPRFGVSSAASSQPNRAVTATVASTSRAMSRPVRRRMATALPASCAVLRRHVTADQTAMGRLMPR